MGLATWPESGAELERSCPGFLALCLLDYEFPKPVGFNPETHSGCDKQEALTKLMNEE